MHDAPPSGRGWGTSGSRSHSRPGLSACRPRHSGGQAVGSAPPRGTRQVISGAAGPAAVLLVVVGGCLTDWRGGGFGLRLCRSLAPSLARRAMTGLLERLLASMERVCAMRDA